MGRSGHGLPDPGKSGGEGSSGRRCCRWSLGRPSMASSYMRERDREGEPGRRRSEKQGRGEEVPRWGWPGLAGVGRRQGVSPAGARAEADIGDEGMAPEQSGRRGTDPGLARPDAGSRWAERACGGGGWVGATRQLRIGCGRRRDDVAAHHWSARRGWRRWTRPAAGGHVRWRRGEEARA